jgi:thioredoxin domain-containing protein 5
MQNKLAVAEVNCDDHGALCQSQGINGYPVLQLYAYGAKTEYNGGRELDQLRAFGDRVSAP